MDAASNTSTFEPSSDLIQEEDCNTLLVYLPGFTKEQLKVQLTRTRLVKISGRRALPNNRWSSFQKDFPVPENCDTNKISAKFEEGILYVRLPKEDKKIAPAETAQPAEKLPPPPPPKKIDPPPSPPKKIDPPPPRPPTPMRTTGEIKESSAPPKKPVDESREDTRSAEKSSEAAEGGRKEKRRHTEEMIGDRKAEKGGGSGRAEAEYKKLSPAARLKVARQQVTNIVVLLLVFGLGIYVARLPWFSKRPHEGSGSRGEEEEEIGRKRLGKYEVGRTLGEGNFGKVKYARNVESGESFAIKILEKNRIVDLNITDQIKREIGTLKLLKHPNVVRLHEVLASKAKIYMVLEYVNGGELFDRIASRGKYSEAQGRKLFQQLIDGVTYCHNKGVYHRDLKLENVLIDESGLIKITDFGLSALPQHFRDDGLLHTTCGSPNYVAPEILSNKGYDGATSDTWSCGVILYVILTGYLPFDDRNLAVLYQKIFKGDAQIPKWLSPGAKNLIKRILDPNPHTRISMHDIKDHGWFKQDYTPLGPDEEDCACTEDELSSVHDITTEAERDPDSPYVINAFQLIGMSSCLDLSGFFEKEVVSERNIRFTSNHCPKELLERIEHTVVEMGFHVQKKNGKLKVTLELKDQKAPAILSVAAEVFEISPAFYVVELRKTCGDSTVYRELCAKLSNELGVSQSQVQLNDCGLQTAG